MDKRQRVANTLSGQPVDRPPVCFWRHYGPQQPQETVRQHIDFFHAADMDILKMMCDEFFTYPMDENATPQEILAMRPLGREHYYVRGQAERAGQINEALKGEVFTLYNAFSPYATLKHTLGDEKSMTLIRDHEEAALHLLEIICEDTCHMVEAVLKESGTAGMMLPLQGAEVDRFGEEEYLTMVTRQGVIKRSLLTDFEYQRKGGKIAITLDEGDELVFVRHTYGDGELILATASGSAVQR